MKILNEAIPIINTYDAKNPSIYAKEDLPAGAATLEYQFRDNASFNIWYCLFSCHNSFEIYNIRSLVGPNILEKVINREAFLVLDNALEPFTKSINSIYQHIVVKEKIPGSQVILLTNMYDAKTYSDNLAKALNCESIRIFWFTVFEKDLQDAVNYIYKKNLPKTLEFKKYSKKFLNFNRRWRLHRPYLTALLYGRNLIDKGYISLGPCDNGDNWTRRWLELTNHFRKDKETLELLTQCESVKDMGPLYLDTEELHINRAECTIDTNKYYEETYFSVVSETTFFTREWYPTARFLSEKVFKPIAMKHPFILVSVPNTLDVLRNMGYKTFSPIIDESYDKELDDAKRMSMIVNEIERLCNLNDDELNEFLIKSKEICDYNFKRLMKKIEFIVEL